MAKREIIIKDDYRVSLTKTLNELKADDWKVKKCEEHGNLWIVWLEK